MNSLSLLFPSNKSVVFNVQLICMYFGATATPTNASLQVSRQETGVCVFVCFSTQTDKTSRHLFNKFDAQQQQHGQIIGQVRFQFAARLLFWRLLRSRQINLQQNLSNKCNFSSILTLCLFIIPQILVGKCESTITITNTNTNTNSSFREFT